jgi:hypothetical protein
VNGTAVSKDAEPVLTEEEKNEKPNTAEET